MSKSTQSTPKSAAQILEQQMSAYPKATVRKIAHAAQVSYIKLYNASKKAIVGEIYDPEKLNFEEMAKILGNDKLLDIRWEELEANGGKKATLTKDMAKFEVGQKVYLRRDNEKPYVIIHKTETHIVIQHEGSETPLAWQNDTFLINGPVFEPRVKKNAK